MPYKIPSDNLVSDAILIVMHRCPQIRSQKELTLLVKKELDRKAEDGFEYRISAERVRRVAIQKQRVTVSIEYHESSQTTRPETCPVCRNPLIPIVNQTLDGGTVEIMRKCNICSYSMGKNKRVPGRYVFTERNR